MGLTLCNLRFSDHIDLVGGSEEEHQLLTERLEVTAAGYGGNMFCEKAKSSSAALSQHHLST